MLRIKTMLKWGAPAVLSLAVLGGLAGFGRAYAGDDRDNRNDRYSRHRERRETLTGRAKTIRDRVDTLYHDRKISRNHRDRAVDRLDRTRDNWNGGSRSGSGNGSDRERLRTVEDTIDQWSSGAYYRRWGRSR